MTRRSAILLVVAVDAVLVWPFMYTNGFGHHDINAMQMGLYAPAESAWRYAEGVSFAWYWFAAALRRVLALSPEQFPVAINAIAVGASTIGDVLLMLTAATAVSIEIAVLGTLFWRFTPEIWEVGTYGHPVTLALPLFLAAVFILAAAPRRHGAIWTAALLFIASFAMRADMLLLAPVAAAAAYEFRRDATRAVVISAVAATVVCGVLQLALSGSEVARLVAASAGDSISLRRWIGNAAVFGYGAGVISIAIVGVAAAARFRVWWPRTGWPWMVVALAPTLVLWVPHGGATRHLIPVYLVLAFTLGAIVNSRWPRPAAALIVVALVVTSNAAAAELVLQWGGDRRYTSLQFGEARRVVERVPVGNMWSNHRAIERLNTLEGLYVAWALRCSEHRGPIVFAQQFPYRLVTEASETYGTPSITQWGLYQFGADAPRLWVAKIPESSAMSWWNDLPSKTGDAARDVALLGPRIPRELAAVWHRQHVESSAARDAEDSIASRSCTPVENALLR